MLTCSRSDWPLPARSGILVVMVDRETLVPVGGISAILGGALWAVNAALYRGEEFGPASGLLFVLPVLFILGLAGVYVRYSGRMQNQGNAGFTQSLVGLTMLAGGFLADLTLGIEDTARIATFGYIILTFGLVLLGYATLKTEPLPRWNFLPLALGLVTPFGIILTGVEPLQVALSAVFGIGWAALGYILLTDRGTEHEEPPAQVK